VGGSEAQHADAFACSLAGDHVEAMVVAVAEHRSALVEPPKTPSDYLVMLKRRHMTETVAAQRSFIDELWRCSPSGRK
jgi:predicted dithiol-disulfide oxidoreductase (DUF899 family)